MRLRGRPDTNAVEWPGALQLLRALLLVGGTITTLVAALSGDLSAVARVGLAVGGIAVLVACVASGRPTPAGRRVALVALGGYLLIAAFLTTTEEIEASMATFAMPAVSLVVLLTPWATPLYNRTRGERGG